MTESYSIVVPAYNAELTIARCLTSVLEQTLVPREIIVVDDCSSDGTEAVVRTLLPQFRKAGIEATYVRATQNAGPSRSRNLGMAAATGRYVAFLDSDDAWAPIKLAIVDYFLSRSKAALIWHSYAEHEPLVLDARPTDFTARLVSLTRLLVRNPGQTSCVVMRNDTGMRFDESMRYCEDYDLWMRIAERNDVVELVGRALTRLGRPQLTSGGLSGNTGLMRIGEMRVYLNFCRRAWFRRGWLLPPLWAFSMMKHIYSWGRRRCLS